MKDELKKYRKEEVLKTPEDYFDKFAYRMQMTIGEEEKKTSWLTKIAYTLKLRWSVPLMTVVMLSFFGIWYEQNDTVQLNDQDLMLFLAEENTDWWSTDELMDLTYEAKSPSYISDQELLMYLKEENIEHELIQSF